MTKITFLLLTCLLLDSAAAMAADSAKLQQFSGNISWYGLAFNCRKTASGEIFNMYKFTAAHRKLKFFTKVLVEDPKTGKSVVVKVNDRGPYSCGRIMDISRGAATVLGTISRGIAYVDCTVLDSDAK
jgi:rare lipoprotein A